MARDAARRGERVWWIAPGTQRSHLLRALTSDGPLLGVEVLTWQQLAYRLLSDARQLKPLLTGSGRLATVGEALLADRDDPPTPGEARLFARAIAEAKAYRVPPGRIPGKGDEVERLRRVAHRYEERKGEAWDYDDFRAEAAAMLEAGPPKSLLDLLPDRVLIDGVDELTPADLRLVDAVAAVRPVHLTIATLPHGRSADEQLADRSDRTVHRHHFANPVAETRWALRDVKATLASGADPLDLALIVPPGRARAVAALAHEYGIPIMDETPRGLADTPEGRRLLDLLDLADAPTPSRLLGIPELRDLGAAALEAGVAGRDAIARLAAERGDTDVWATWIARLEPLDDPLAWGAELIEAAWSAVHPHQAEEAGESRRASSLDRDDFRDEALQRLAEARRVARPGDDGSHLRGWWSALLREPLTFERPNAGVALLHAPQAIGRHVKHAWILGVTEGAHQPRAKEDYFVPEDDRTPQVDPHHPQLPTRFRGDHETLAATLRARGDVTTLTVPQGTQGGPATPDRILLDGETTDPPAQPAGSALDLADGERYLAPEGAVDLGPPDVHRVARFAECGLRTWGERHTRQDETDPPTWLALRRALLERDSWTETDLRTLAREHPAHEAWVDAHAESLARLTWSVTLRESETGLTAHVDAALREHGEAHLVRFTAPGTLTSSEEAERVLDRRPELYWAAAHLLRHHPRSIQRLHLRVWPIDGAPIDFPERPINRIWSRFERVERDVQAALPAWHAGEIRANPGFACRSCPVFDVCREGRR